MASLELGLLLLSAVLASSVINQFFPKLSTPLLQIAMGLLIAVLGEGQVSIELDPDLFLVLFIAPLLYDEAREADLGALWHHRASVISYAIGLVLFIVLCVGFALHFIQPSIPLAAAFALGAALGPTDAVAVASVSKTTNVSDNVKAILKGEALLNDASGLVSFQFAVAAVTTGVFSAADAGLEFAFSFFGGIVLGLVCGFVINVAIEGIRDIGYEDTTFNVLFEVFTPFIVFLLAEYAGVSGVITVVVCGVINVQTRRKNGPSLSRTSIVSSSVWKVLSFALNGVVFVLLGTQLPGTMFTSLQGSGMDVGHLMLLVAAIAAILLVTRFLWSIIAIALEKKKGERRFGKKEARDAAILTLSGAKGTITLAIMFTIPTEYVNAAGTSIDFPYRDLLIFLASGAIVVTLLLATFVVPLLAPKPKVKKSDVLTYERNVEANLDVLRAVIEELNERQTKETVQPTRQVIQAYNDRIERVKGSEDESDSAELMQLRLGALAWQRDYVREKCAAHEIDDDIAQRCLDHVRTMERLIRHEGVWAEIGQSALRAWSWTKARVHHAVNKLPVVAPAESEVEYRALKRECYLHVIHKLEDLMGDEGTATENIAKVLLGYQRLFRQMSEHSPSVTTMARVSDKADEIEALALRLELKYIQQMVDEERMTRSYAREMREEVALMQIDLEDTV